MRFTLLLIGRDLSELLFRGGLLLRKEGELNEIEELNNSLKLEIVFMLSLFIWSQ